MEQLDIFPLKEEDTRQPRRLPETTRHKVIEAMAQVLLEIALPVVESDERPGDDE